jgi:two-component system LytT family response regulator
MRVRTIIVDDEPLARASIASLLSACPQVEVIAQCCNGFEAIGAIRRSRPELVFLDVQMPECDGFDVLEQLGSDAPASLIFVTAYDRYAVKAFETGALDYILKPFTDERFQKALHRALVKVAEHKSEPRNILVKAGGRVTIIKPDEIDWIEAADYYACLHVAGKSHMIRRSLADLEADLDPERFSRIHRSIIVNRDRIVTIGLDGDGDPEVVLAGGTRLRMSRNYREALLTRLGGVDTFRSR